MEILKPENRKRLTVVLCVATILFVLAAGLFFVPLYGEVCVENAHSDQQNCAAHHVPVYLVFAAGQFAEDHDGAITGLATLLLAWITYLLVSLGREQSRNSRVQLRAYVFITGVSFKNTGDAFEMKITLKNFGVTPAYNVVINGCVSLTEKSILDVYGQPPSERKQATTIGPGYEVPVRSSFNSIPPTLFKGFEMGHASIHFWGEIIYETFNKTRTSKFSLVNRGGPKYMEAGFVQSEGGDNRAT